VKGLARLHGVDYVVFWRSSPILRFNATTHQQLTDINVKDLREPRDIVACQQRSRLYVADDPKCIWRVSADGADVKRWWSKSSTYTFTPLKLSLTSTRLLVTSFETNELMQLDADGVELRRVQLPDYTRPDHAFESPTGKPYVYRQSQQYTTEPASGQRSQHRW